VGYFEALEEFNDKQSAIEKGNLAPALRDALIKLGRQPAKRLTKFRGYDVLENDAILKVNPRGKEKNSQSLEAFSLYQALSPCRSFNYKKRPADMIGNAVHVMRIATGEAQESLASERHEERARKGGLKGARRRDARRRRHLPHALARRNPRHRALPHIHRQRFGHRSRPPTRPAA
jgi:hypothetical protein